jgi:hypothetical protein
VGANSRSVAVPFKDVPHSSAATDGLRSGGGGTMALCSDHGEALTRLSLEVVKQQLRRCSWSGSLRRVG